MKVSQHHVFFSVEHNSDVPFFNWTVINDVAKGEERAKYPADCVGLDQWGRYLLTLREADSVRGVRWNYQKPPSIRQVASAK